MVCVSASLHSLPSLPATTRWQLAGVVQGVGFRPFVYRLANKHGLTGWVKNCLGQVEVVASGPSDRLVAFEQDLVDEAPEIARVRISGKQQLPAEAFDDFRILESDSDHPADIHVPPDYAVCGQCLDEMRDPQDRRFGYPFINCTQCGPRYTLIEALPYDRASTSMAKFKLCPSCQREYDDAGDRRFHAEPLACPGCGPALQFRRVGSELNDNRQALSACAEALRQGEIVAVKGIGGYHLMCDAANTMAIRRLRARKPREHKPLALMVPEDPGLVRLRAVVELSEKEEALLRTPQRPVVICRKAPAACVSEEVAPELDEIGVMLPYSPLHHLLLDEFGEPLVATSANPAGEPVLTEQSQVEARLADVTDACLHHNRSIVRPADDPVFRSVAGKPRPLRLGRGVAPLELRLPVALDQPVLAVGGHMKNTVCLAWDDRAVVSPHIGDMGTVRSLAVFEQHCSDLQALYGVTAAALLCDRHPGYQTTRWAKQQGLPVFRIQHHRAHASALIAEAGLTRRGQALVFTWDGVGYGDDGNLWGGEAFHGRPGDWQRVASLKPLRLPGGDKASREPWRSGVSVAWALGDAQAARQLMTAALGTDAVDHLGPLLHKAWEAGMNAPLSSAVGRLFDAASALTGVCLNASYEGQGPMQFEAVAGLQAESVDLPLQLQADGMLEADWMPLFRSLIQSGNSRAARAACFHESLAECLFQQTLAIARRYPVDAVGLCGGVFQNRRLVEACVRRLDEQGVEVVLGERLPVNDAGLSFGQVAEFAARAPTTS